MNYKFVFFNILIVLIFSLSTTAAFSNSDDGEWEYKKNIIIKENSGETLTDYQIVVELNTLNFPTEAKSDGSDIRFTDENGIELNYWIEEWNYPSTAKIWVNVQNIPANGDIKLLMYYGNPSAVSASNGEATFLFFDDFEGTSLDLVKWHQGAFGNGGLDILSYSDSVLMFRGSGCGGGSSDWRYAKSNAKWNGDEIALSAKTKRYNGISYVGFGYDSSISDITYLFVGFNPISGENKLDTFLGAFNPDIGLYKPNQFFYDMAPETWYIVDLMKNENTLKGRISDSAGNELNTIERTDIDRNGDVFLSLSGVYNCITVRYYYDWVFVRNYVTDEPTSTIIVNDAPIISADEDAVTFDEGQIAVNNGTMSDADGDDITLSVSVGTVVNKNNGTWSWSFATSDGPDESQQVVITSDDGYGGVTETTFELTVNNVAPIIIEITNDGPRIEGANVTVCITATDPGTDVLSYAIDWNNNGSFEILTNPVAIHKFENAGEFTVNVTVTDEDGAVTTGQTVIIMLTTQEAIEEQINEVEKLIDEEILNEGQDNGLTSKLENIIAKIDKGNVKPAINQLEAFINQINSFISEGVLLQEEGQPLIDAANEIIHLLNQ